MASFAGSVTKASVAAIYDRYVARSMASFETVRPDGHTRCSFEDAIQCGYASEIVRMIQHFEEADWGHYRQVLVPKEGTDEFRPIALPPFGVQVAACGLYQHILANQPQPFPDGFFARPSVELGECNGHQAAARLLEVFGRDAYVFIGDVKSFHDTVPWKPLLTLLSLYAPTESDARLAYRLLTLDVRRDGEEKVANTSGRGIPQGNALSCFAAGLLLYDLSTELESLSRFHGIFVDDIGAAFDTKDHGYAAAQLIRAYLGELGLHLKDGWVIHSPGSTFHYLGSEISI